MNILLVSHQLDYTGAPIALLELAKSLIRLEHKVCISSLKTGPLLTEFIKSGINLFDHEKNTADDYDLIIANTVISVPPSLSFGKSSKKVLAWIHESEYFFNIIRKSPDNFRLDELKFVAFPSKFQIDEFSKWMPSALKVQLKNCVQIPNNIAIDNKGPYFVCSGEWETRKGQDQLVRHLGNLEEFPEIHFVGAIKPLHLSLEKFVFTGHLTPLEAKNRIASSRGVISCAVSETQNLVAIEAMQLGVPVMLSDIPAHRELKKLIPDIVIFDASSIESFRSNFKLLLNQWADSAARMRLKEAATHWFGMLEFDKNVSDLINLVNES
ncbi:glycosyltransferase family 4 protein [Polynucleobacter asymbioticus]|uniref:glycosyltransferase family 4 protein n=1 Tax=Polynucleobacter asymbioticus TaxID=576611 RepID=UPI0008F967BE|nr:glycosyltransferase family 4 protein [Polynucleobacter asymbioticus]